MKIAIISFTHKGGILNESICRDFKNQGISAQGYIPEKYAPGMKLQGFKGLSELVEYLFTSVDKILFIGACGIAVRAIAPFLKSKAEDPAVAVAGEDGRFVISLLSGHLGGANEFSRYVADMIEAVPVITTATDMNQIFAVDNWAVRNNLIVTDLSMIKVISGALLNGEKVGFLSEYPIKGKPPAGLSIRNTGKTGIFISEKPGQNPYNKTLTLLPCNLVLGIGCRKGTAFEIIIEFIKKTFDQYGVDIRRICRICSIEVKREEEGIQLTAKELQVDFATYTAEELKAVSGDFSGSEFVKQTVGVDNVCERSAALGSGYGRMRIPKTAGQGVTLSAYEADFEVDLTL